MKIHRVFLFIPLILFLSQASFAAECGSVTPVFAQTFQRAAGDPFTDHATFPSVNGKATIKLYNGGIEQNKDYRVTDATIRVNGSIVLDEMQFNKQVTYLEAQVYLFEENDIEVYLEGKPDSKVTILILYKSIGFTSEILVGKVFVPIQPDWQPDDVSIAKFSGDGTVFFYNWSPWISPNFLFATWDWSIEDDGRLFMDFPDSSGKPDRCLTLIANTPTYQDWVDEEGTSIDRMRKVIPFDAAKLPGTYSVEGGAEVEVAFLAGGTGWITDNQGTKYWTWSVDNEGVLIGTFNSIIYLLAGSTEDTLNIAGINLDDGNPVELFERTFIRQSP